MQVMVDVGLVNKLVRVPLLQMVTENGSITFEEVFVTVTLREHLLKKRMFF